MSTFLDEVFQLDDDPFIKQMERYGTTDRRIPKTQCECCGTELCDGDRYWDVNGQVVCAECIENMSASELLTMLQVENEDVVEMCGGSEKTIGEPE